MDGPFRYAGVENGDACYCGNADNKFIPTDPGECNIPCTGDQSQFCGSSWRLQVYDTEYTEGMYLSISVTLEKFYPWPPSHVVWVGLKMPKNTISEKRQKTTHK